MSNEVKYKMAQYELPSSAEVLVAGVRLAGEQEAGGLDVTEGEGVEERSAAVSVLRVYHTAVTQQHRHTASVAPRRCTVQGWTGGQQRGLD